jgi:DNA polymerase-1
MHNAKSEIKIMWLHKIYIQDSEYFNKIFSGEEVNYEVPKEEHHIFDTMIASWCEYFSRPCGHGLKELTEEIYKKKSPHFKEIAFRDKKTKMWRIDLGDFKKVAYYACEDAINTYKLYEYFKPLIDNNKKTKKIFYELEMQQVKVLSEMEISGMPTSKKTLKKIGKNIDRELKILKKEIYKICGTKEINLNSMQQLNEVFFKKLKLKPKTKKGKNGFYSLGKTILILYAKEKIKIAEVLLKYRGLAKLKNTYIDKLIDKIVDNKLYSNFYQTSVVTGRLSSANPSFQTMPNNNLYPIRSAFKSQKGCKWICLDYNQLELRVASHYGDDRVMIEAFKNNVDIHGQISKLSFNLDCDANEVKKLYPEVRKKGKSLSFGLLYGMSYMTMAFRVNLEMDYDHEMSDDVAKKAMSNFFKSFPGIAKYIKTQKKLVNKYGKVKNLIGKIYDLPDGMLEVTDRRNYDIFKRKARAERQATNYPIQGGASSIITVAMRDIRNYFIERGNWMKNLFLVSQIHDELNFISDKEISEEVFKVSKEKMENSLKLKVPLVAEGSINTSWFSAK